MNRKKAEEVFHELFDRIAVAGMESRDAMPRPLNETTCCRSPQELLGAIYLIPLA